MPLLLQIFLASIASSLLGLIGGFLLLQHHEKVKKMSGYFLSFAVGTILAVVFFDLLPEVLGEGEVESVMTWLVFGIMLFYILERLLFWYHCHDDDCHVHSIPALVVIGDSIHNAIDGVVIASTFLLDPKLGWLTTLAVFAHEIPQEIGDFSALIHSGMKRTKIAWLNILSALFSPIVAILSYFFINQNLLIAATAISAGNLIYLACADLIPEIHHEFKYKKVFVQVFLTLLGVFSIWFLVKILPHG